MDDLVELLLLLLSFLLLDTKVLLQCLYALLLCAGVLLRRARLLCTCAPRRRGRGWCRLLQGHHWLRWHLRLRLR